MNLRITDHAIIRRYEKFRFLYGSETITKDKLLKDIKDDFNNSTKFKLTHNATLFKSQHAFYVVIYENFTPVIVTTYPIINLPKGYDISFYENIRLIYKCDIPIEESRIIEPIIKTEDFLIVKHSGHKKLIWVSGFLLLCALDFNKELVYYNIIKKWNIEDLKDKDTQRSINSVYFDSEFKWNEFLSKIDLLDFIYNPSRKELDSPEINTYKRVLNGSLKIFPQNFWQEDIGGEIKIASQLCTRYMIEEILNWGVYEICNYLDKKIFVKNKLGGMLDTLFKGGIFEAIDNAYPDKYPIGMIKHANTIKYWTRENDGVNHARRALKWVVEDCENDGLAINKNVLLSYDWASILKKYSLSRILTITFDNDLREFLEQGFEVKINNEDYERHFNSLDKKLNRYVKNHF